MSTEDEEERIFQELYGPWAPASSDEIRRWLAGWNRPWWVAGGHAIEAFTGSSRPHGDVDIAVFRKDVPALHAHLAGELHLWSAGSGSLRPLWFPPAGIDTAELPTWAGQVWIRRRSTGPWLVDVLTTEDREGAWTCRLDPGLALPLEDVVWIPEQGPWASVRVLRPEYVLAHKARHDKPKDREDLESAVPMLDPRARGVLVELITRAHPGHEWLELMGTLDPPES